MIIYEMVRPVQRHCPGRGRAGELGLNKCLCRRRLAQGVMGRAGLVCVKPLRRRCRGTFLWSRHCAGHCMQEGLPSGGSQSMAMGVMQMEGAVMDALPTVVETKRKDGVCAVGPGERFMEETGLDRV